MASRSLTSVVALAWCRFQPRTAALAAAVDGEAHFVAPTGGGRLSRSLPGRYVRSAVITWRQLEQSRPAVVIAITPPVFAPLVAWMWCRRHGRQLVIDFHTGALHSRRWGWAQPLHRFLARRAAAVTLHTNEAADEVSAWGVRALLLPDDVPDAPARTSSEERPACRVVVAGSLDHREPVAAALAAAALTPDVEWRFTGDPEQVSRDVRERAPVNAVFTGWLAYDRFLDELASADAVAAFSTDTTIMNRAAFEAIGLERPLILTDLPGLRGRFSDAAVFCANDPASMAAAVRHALADRDRLEARSRELKARLRQMHSDALSELETALGRAPVLARV